MRHPDPNDVDFIDNIKRLLGIDAKGVEALLPKLDPDALIDLAAAVTNSDKREVMRLIRIGREQMMHEDRLIAKKSTERKRKDKEPLFDEENSNDLNVGDAVEAGGREGTVKIPKAPGDTVGVMIGGSLEMIHRSDVTKKTVSEGVLGMTGIPDLRRMQELAGIPSVEVDEIPAVEAPAAAPVEFSSVTSGAGDLDECGASAVALLDELSKMLPNLRLADIKAIRKRMNDIQMQMNESIGYSKPMVEAARRVEGRKTKV